MKNYYVANPEYCDAVYGDQEPVCMDAREVKRLAYEWGMDASELFDQLHEATTDEIDEYGVYDTPLSDSEFAAIWDDALKAADRDAYISDWALSSIWADPEDAEVPTERIAYLSRLWDLAHATVKEICTAAGITMSDLSLRTGAPYRTLQNWNSGARKFPAYDRLLIVNFLGLMPTI